MTGFEAPRQGSQAVVADQEMHGQTFGDGAKPGERRIIGIEDHVATAIGGPHESVGLRRTVPDNVTVHETTFRG